MFAYVCINRLCTIYPNTYIRVVYRRGGCKTHTYTRTRTGTHTHKQGKLGLPTRFALRGVTYATGKNSGIGRAWQCVLPVVSVPYHF